MADKFETIEDARDFINGQLVGRGFLRAGQQIRASGEAEDAKLIINTMHKLLKTIRAKDDQLSEWQARELRERRRPPVAPPAEVPARRSRGPVVRKRLVKRSDEGLRKMYQVRTNKLQATIDELRDRIQRDAKHRDSDVTWRVHQDLTTVEATEPPPEDDQLTPLLERLSSHQQLCAELRVFFDNVNRFTYSSSVLGITDITLKEQHQTVLDGLLATGDASMVELVEYINDWYQIIDLGPEGT